MAILVLNNIVDEIESSVEEFNTRKDRIEETDSKLKNGLLENMFTVKWIVANLMKTLSSMRNIKAYCWLSKERKKAKRKCNDKFIGWK